MEASFFLIALHKRGSWCPIILKLMGNKLASICQHLLPLILCSKAISISGKRFSQPSHMFCGGRAMIVPQALADVHIKCRNIPGIVDDVACKPAKYFQHGFRLNYHARSVWIVRRARTIM